MFTKICHHLRGQYLGAIALFVALGGTTYAATSLPAGSVGAKQLRNGAVTNRKLANGSVTNPKLAKGAVSAAKLDPKTIAGSVRAYAEIAANGQIYAASPSATTIGWQTTGPGSGGTIQWSQRMAKTCFALATIVGFDGSSASAILVGGSKADALTYVKLSNPGQQVDVAVVCPKP